MSHPFSPHAFHATSEDGSSVASTLLTPPLTPRDHRDVPYRPTEADQTSLNMRKRKQKRAPKGRRRHHAQLKERANSASDNVRVKKATALSVIKLNRSKSLSLLHDLRTGSASNRAIQEVVTKLRRWTLPSKSTSTCVFTPLRSTVKQSTLSDATESPAMITLRRATTTHPPNKVEMTFFPEPTFGSERSNLLSYLVSTFSRVDTTKSSSRPKDLPRSKVKTVRARSIENTATQPTWTFPAATVCTETSVESNFAMPGVIEPTTPPRRCSTKYVAGDTSFEVIWDGNDGSTTSPDSSRPSVASGRRCSMAVVKLEAQLARSLPDSRRPSDQSRKSSSTGSEGSASKLFEQALTPEKLDSILPRLTQAASLRDLPRSRGTGNGRKSECKISLTAADCCVMDNGNSRCTMTGIDCFPPLCGRRTSYGNVAAWGESMAAQQRQRQSFPTSLNNPEQRSTRSGSMIGSSSHARRRSSMAVNPNDHHQDQAKARRTSKAIRGIMNKNVEDNERMPLLQQASGQ